MLRDSPPRIGVDGFNLALPRGTGVATYARTLTHCLKAMGCAVDVLYGMNIPRQTPTALREVMFFDSLDQESTGKLAKAWTMRWWRDCGVDMIGHTAVDIPISGRVEVRGFAHRMPAFDRILNVQHLYRVAARHFQYTGRFLTVTIPDPPAIMHWTYPLPIRLKDARNIYTIHDLVPLRLPQTTLDDKKYYFSLIRKLALQADAICTVSEASRAEILSFFPEVKERLYNTYQSFQPSMSMEKSQKDDFTQKSEGLFDLRPGEFFLFFGSLEPKKNLGRLIESFLMAQTDRPLVIVGAMAWKSEAELRFLARGVSTGRIRQLEYLPTPLLMALIRGARAVLFPSLSEGFGLPVLEALSFGTPVLTSREGALPEVAGEAALFVDAYDTSSITARIEELDRDDALRAKLRDRGPHQAACFNMKKYEDRVREMYEAVL
ncbi:glycosyl transferase group 1 [Gluconacetobacter diazotrophicus PA1 5]|uniref:glycosyltransferase family 4 protein n=1 Tax=Gluconacetobacter diazotrophicus TaxID=33996 RepID=UPI000173B1AD|nr:glycosyltransferase family 1 protein [Gluconacetobacter diazotrophicus]ACI50454.1 glycosyl transferase group 1 [Gluconacetobacter diazotrophicus PA1 5]TWA98316.1 glycosyltransferase involved in cell wall biosynthesis [Gluconacetobacter diazotrophicus]